MNINCFFLSLLNDYVLKYEINHLLWHLNRFFNKKLETFSCWILEEEDNPVHCTNCLRLPHAERDFNIMPSGRWISIELIKWKSFKPQNSQFAQNAQKAQRTKMSLLGNKLQKWSQFFRHAQSVTFGHFGHFGHVF